MQAIGIKRRARTLGCRRGGERQALFGCLAVTRFALHKQAGRRGLEAVAAPAPSDPDGWAG